MANAMNFGATSWGAASWDPAMMPAADAQLLAELLAPRPVVKPPIRVPRSVRREVSDGDLQAAADMMAKLRRRDDSRKLAAGATPADAGRALAVAVDRLLMVL